MSILYNTKSNITARQEMINRFERAAQLQRTWKSWLDTSPPLGKDGLPSATGSYAAPSTGLRKKKARPRSAMQVRTKPSSSPSATSLQTDLSSVGTEDLSAPLGGVTPTNAKKDITRRPQSAMPSRPRPTSSTGRIEKKTVTQSVLERSIAPSPQRVARESTENAIPLDPPNFGIFLQQVTQILVQAKQESSDARSRLKATTEALGGRAVDSEQVHAEQMASDRATKESVALSMASMEALIVSLHKGFDECRDEGDSLSVDKLMNESGQTASALGGGPLGVVVPAIGTLLYEVFDALRSSIYVDHIPFLADLPVACQASASGTTTGWLQWVLERKLTFEGLTTQRQAVQLQAPSLLQAHSDKFFHSMQERHREEGMSFQERQQQHTHAPRLSFMDRRQKLRTHFRAWRAITKRVVAGIRFTDRTILGKETSLKRWALHQWRVSVAHQIRARRAGDICLATKELQKQEHELDIAGKHVELSKHVLSEFEATLRAHEAEIHELRTKVEHYQSPMVFDFREPIADARRDNVLREGVIRFKQQKREGISSASTTAEGEIEIVSQHGVDDQVFLDLVQTPPLNEGVAQPGFDSSSSFYAIRVDLPKDAQDPPLDWMFSNAMSFCRTKKQVVQQWIKEKKEEEEETNGTSGLEKKELTPLEQRIHDAHRLTSNQRKLLEKGWEGALLRQYAGFLTDKEEFNRSITEAAIKLRSSARINRCLVLTKSEPTPSFYVKRLGTLRDHPELYLAAMSVGMSVAFNIAAATALRPSESSSLFQQSDKAIAGTAEHGEPEGTVGTEQSLSVSAREYDIRDVHRVAAFLGCVQQISAEELETDTETVHRLLVARLMAYSTNLTALEQDQLYRARALGGNPAEGGLSAAAMEATSLSMAGETTSSSSLSMGPSGVLRMKKCRNLLGLVAQRDGTDYTVDRSAIEVLAWVREVLTAAQGTKTRKERKKSSVAVGSPSSSMRAKRREDSGAESSDAALVNVQNLEEDFGDGLELLVSIVNHLCPPSHVPNLGPYPTAESTAEYLVRTAMEELRAPIPRVVVEQLATCTPSVKLLYLSALYCVLHKAPPLPSLPAPSGASEGQSFLSSTGSSGVPSRSHSVSFPFTGGDSGSETSSTMAQTVSFGVSTAAATQQAPPVSLAQQRATLINQLNSAVQSLHPHITTAGPLPPPVIKHTRLVPLFGKAAVIDGAFAAVTKSWPVLFSAFLRDALWSSQSPPSTAGHGGLVRSGSFAGNAPTSPLNRKMSAGGLKTSTSSAFHNASSSAFQNTSSVVVSSHTAKPTLPELGLTLDGTLRLLERLNLLNLPAFGAQQQFVVKRGLASTTTSQSSTEDLSETSTSRRRSSTTGLSFGTSKSVEVALQYPQLARWFFQAVEMNDDELRDDSTRERDLRVHWKSVPSTLLGKLQKGNLFLTTATLPEFLMRLACCGSVPLTESSSSNTESLLQWQQGNVDRVFGVLKDVVHRFVSASTSWGSIETSLSGKPGALPLPATHNALTAKAQQHSPMKFVDPRHFRHQLFTPDMLRLLRTKSTFLVRLFVSHSFFTLQTWKVLDHREMTFAQFLSVLQLRPSTGGIHTSDKVFDETNVADMEDLSDGPVEQFGLHSQVAIPLPLPFVGRLFALVSLCRRTKGSDFSVPTFMKVPPQANVPGCAALEVKTSLAGTIGEQMTVGYSGFVEALLLVALCLHPHPWISPMDRVSFFFSQLEQSSPS